MPSTSAGMSCFLRAAICATSRLRRKPFAHVHDLRPARCQSPENTQILARQPSTGFRSEQHEPGDHLGIDPV